VTSPAGLDLDRLTAYAPELFGPQVRAELIPGGRSNLSRR